MNTLWFVKFERVDPVRVYWSTEVVFCHTADSVFDAAVLGWSRIAINSLYKITRIEAICSTPDTVLDFEPC